MDVIISCSNSFTISFCSDPFFTVAPKFTPTNSSILSIDLYSLFSTATSYWKYMAIPRCILNRLGIKEVLSSTMSPQYFMYILVMNMRR